MIAVTIYKNRNNKISLGLKADGVLQDVSSSTRMTLNVGDKVSDFVVDSRQHSNAFDWTTNGANGQVDIDIARIDGVMPGTYRCRLTVYDATYTSGLVWDELQVVIK